MARRLEEDPLHLGRLRELDAAVALVDLLPFPVEVAAVQNIYWRILLEVFPRVRDGGGDGSEWLQTFRGLGENLGVRLP